MTLPVTDPATTAPATTPTAAPEPVQTPATAAPAPATPAPAKKSLEDSLAPLDDDTRAFVLAEVSKARKEAGDSRAAAKTKAAEDARAELAQTIGKALGLVADDEKADPAKLTEQLTATAADARQAKVELAVFRAAQAASADASALLDSRSFLAKLADIDPTDSAAVSAAVTEAVTANPAFAVASGRRLPAPNPAQGSSGSGAPDVETQIITAQKAGDWKTVVALQNSKLAAAKRG